MSNKRVSLPYLVWMGIFIVVPLAMIVFFAFTSSDGSFSFANILAVGEYSSVFLNSIFLGAIATAISLLIGYPLALIISRMASHRQRTMVLLVMLPMWMSFLLRTYAWMTLLENNGIINSILTAIGLPELPMINTPGAVVLGMVYNYLPYMIMPLYSILSKLDNSIIEASQDLGASHVHVFGKIILPLSLPGIISGITMVFVPAVSTFIISKMLGGSGNLLIGDLIDMQFIGAAYNPNLGAAISLVLMILILICIGIMNQFDDGETDLMMM